LNFRKRLARMKRKEETVCFAKISGATDGKATRNVAFPSQH
jgi:hypothetical protein